MSRSGWGFLVALVGWLILAAAPPQQSARTQDGVAANSIEQRLGDVAAALNAANEREDYNPECKEGEDNRRSDLCAQWKAADAAYSSSIYTFWTMWATIAAVALGIGTLGAAIAAAIFASGAVRETRRIGEAQVRAYVRVSNVAMRLHRDIPLYAFTVENCGQSPARDLVLMCRGGIDVGDEPPGEFLGTRELVDIPASSELELDHVIMEQGRERLKDGASIFVHVIAGWTDVFGKQGTTQSTWCGLYLPDEEFITLVPTPDLTVYIDAEKAFRQRAAEQEGEPEANHDPQPERGQV